MFRRIFLTGCILSLVVFGLIFSISNTKAQTATATPTRTPTTFVMPTSTAYPGAEFTGTPLSGSAPLTVQFTHLNANRISSCLWTFGDGTTLSAPPASSQTSSFCPSVSHTYATAGSYTVSLRVIKATNSLSTTITKTNYIQVGGATPTVVTPTPTSTTCSNSLTITGRISNSSTGVAIAGANVYVNTSVPHQFATTSAADGTYSINIPTTSNDACLVVELRVTATNYNTVSMVINSAELFAQPTRDFGLIFNAPSPTPRCGAIVVVTASPTPTRTPTPRTATATATTCGPRYVTATPGVPSLTPTHNPITPAPSATRTPTNTAGPSLTPSKTPTLVADNFCSPVSSTIAAPFSYDGVGTFCWQSSNLGSYINSWSTSSVIINGVNITNVYVGSGSYPAKIGGFWYVTYNGPYAWSHFEAK